MDNLLAIEISTCAQDRLHVFQVLFSLELTTSAIQFFKYHPEFKPISTECLYCNGVCDVRVVLPGTEEHAEQLRTFNAK